MGDFLEIPCEKVFEILCLKKNKALLYAKKVFAMTTTVFTVVRKGSGIKCLLKSYFPNMW